MANAVRFTKQLASREERKAALDGFRRLEVALHTPGPGELDEILELSLGKGITGYDAAYVVHARRTGATLITADQRLVGRMDDPRVRPLSRLA